MISATSTFLASRRRRFVQDEISEQWTFWSLTFTHTLGLVVYGPTQCSASFSCWIWTTRSWLNDARVWRQQAGQKLLLQLVYRYFASAAKLAASNDVTIQAFCKVMAIPWLFQPLYSNKRILGLQDIISDVKTFGNLRRIWSTQDLSTWPCKPLCWRFQITAPYRGP